MPKLLTKNTKKMIALMQVHHDTPIGDSDAPADAATGCAIRGGAYSHNNGQCCVIGCLTNGSANYGIIENIYGIPETAARLLEYVFEALPCGEQPDFALACAKAVACDGKDLSLVPLRFVLELAKRIETHDSDVVQTALEMVISGDWDDATILRLVQEGTPRTAGNADSHGNTLGNKRARVAACSFVEQASVAVLMYAGLANDLHAPSAIVACTMRATHHAGARGRVAAAAEAQQQAKDLMQLLKSAPVITT